MNNSPKPRRGFNFGGSLKARIALVAAGLLILIMLSVIIASFFNQADKAQADRLTEVAQAQTEIIRISAIGQDKAKGVETVNFALNTELSMYSAQSRIKSSLNKRGVGSKSLDKILAQSKNSKTDEALAEAEKNNRFDETFMAIMDKQLSDYQKLLKNAHDNASPSEKAILAAAFQSAANLAGQ